MVDRASGSNSCNFQGHRVLELKTGGSGYSYSIRRGTDCTGYEQITIGDCDYNGSPDYVRAMRFCSDKAPASTLPRYNFVPKFSSVTCRVSESSVEVEKPILASECFSSLRAEFSASLKVADDFQEAFQNVRGAFQKRNIKDIKFVKDNDGKRWELVFVDSKSYPWKVKIWEDEKGDRVTSVVFQDGRPGVDDNSKKADIIVRGEHADWIAPIEFHIPELRAAFSQQK